MTEGGVDSKGIWYYQEIGDGSSMVAKTGTLF